MIASLHNLQYDLYLSQFRQLYSMQFFTSNGVMGVHCVYLGTQEGVLEQPWH